MIKYIYVGIMTLLLVACEQEQNQQSNMSTNMETAVVQECKVQPNFDKNPMNVISKASTMYAGGENLSKYWQLNTEQQGCDEIWFVETEFGYLTMKIQNNQVYQATVKMKPEKSSPLALVQTISLIMAVSNHMPEEETEIAKELVLLAKAADDSGNRPTKVINKIVFSTKKEEGSIRFSATATNL